jgi:hypothetical protein
MTLRATLIGTSDLAFPYTNPLTHGKRRGEQA